VALNHAHGTLTIEADEIVNREHGKNPLTRKEWDKEVRVAIGKIGWILVQSRDRMSFDFDLIDGTRTSMLHVDSCAPKADLDAFVREFAGANPSALIQLAHPTYGLPDPVHELAKQAAKRAADFNAAEAKRREHALGARPEVKVKTYDNHKDFEHDAKKMTHDGWMPDQQVADRGKVSVGGTVAKTVFTGGLGLITGLSHKSDKVTVTWVKQPKGFVPKEFLEVPDVPAPRVFPHEPYFGATILSPVRKGEEFRQAPPPQSQLAPTVVMSAIETPAVSPLPEGKSVVEKLRDLAALRDEGIISSEEFEAKKAELLAAF
jgi:Short C-terminal domain